MGLFNHSKGGNGKKVSSVYFLLCAFYFLRRILNFRAVAVRYFDVWSASNLMCTFYCEIVAIGERAGQIIPSAGTGGGQVYHC